MSAAAAGRPPDGDRPVDVLVVQPDPGDGPGLLGDWLTGAGRRLSVVCPERGEALPDRLAAAALVVLGGEVSAHDDERAPWLAGICRLLGEAVAAGVPTLAVCLGAQLLARAGGGRVRLADPAGPEVGVHPVRPLPAAAADPLFAGLADPAPALQYHYDAVAALPPGAVHLLAGDRFPHQGYRLGRRAWGVQFHPEVTAADFAGWLESGATGLRRRGLDPQQLAAQARGQAGALAATWRPVAERFAALPAAAGPG